MKRMASLLSFLLLVVLVGYVTMSMVALAAPTLPNDVQMIEPDSSLPKELRNFWGKWTGMQIVQALYEVFIIVEKIDKDRASLYFWSTDTPKWTRINANVMQDGNQYSIQFISGGTGRKNTLSLKKDGSMEYFYSDVSSGNNIIVLNKVP